MVMKLTMTCSIVFIVATMLIGCDTGHVEPCERCSSPQALMSALYHKFESEEYPDLESLIHPRLRGQWKEFVYWDGRIRREFPKALGTEYTSPIDNLREEVCHGKGQWKIEAQRDLARVRIGESGTSLVLRRHYGQWYIVLYETWEVAEYMSRLRKEISKVEYHRLSDMNRRD